MENEELESSKSMEFEQSRNTVATAKFACSLIQNPINKSKMEQGSLIKQQ